MKRDKLGRFAKTPKTIWQITKKRIVLIGIGFFMAVWPMYTSFFTEMLTYIDYPRVTFAKQLVYSAEQDQLSPETKQRIKQIAESLWEQKFEVRKSEDFLEAMMQVQNELTDLISQYPNATSTESLYQ